MASGFYIQCRDAITYAIKPIAPELIAENGISWVYQQQGGLASIDVSFCVPFEETPIAVGDFLEVCAFGEFDSLGFPLPRARGIVTIPEPRVDTTEVYKITAMGRMFDMDKTVLYQTFLLPAGSPQDLVNYAALVYDAYLTRVAQRYAGSTPVAYTTPFTLVMDESDLQTESGGVTTGGVGINLSQLVCGPSTARQAMDSLYNQGSGSICWGWDIEPLAGCDRFYLRARGTQIQHQFNVGGSVKSYSQTAELDQLVNAAWLMGGAATYPNLATNASFEQIINPSSSSGGLLLNGGFENPNPPTDDNPGYSNNAQYWYFSTSASRNWYDPATNHNASAHSGKYYLLLDGAVAITGLPADASDYTGQSPLTDYGSFYGSGDWAYQDMPLPEDWATLVSNGTVADGVLSLVASLYAAQESGAAPLASGYMIVLGMSGSISDPENGTPTGEYGVLPITPPSTAWIGGDDIDTIGTGGYELPVFLTNSSTTYIRCYLACTSSQGALHALLIDDCTLAIAGSVGQYGWGTHVENPGDGQSINCMWATAAAAWDGAYGVRASVVAADSNFVYISPAGDSNQPDNNWNSQFHFKPTPQQELVCAFRVRMSPGLNSGPGYVRAEYREWDSSGAETQVDFIPDNVDTGVEIPNDGTWYVVWVQISAHGNAAEAMFQIGFAGNGTYDIDGVSVRDSSSAEAQIILGLGTAPSNDATQQPVNGVPINALYLRGANFAQYVTAAQVCTDPASPNAGDAGALASVGTYGLKEAVVNNSQIVDWNSDTAAYMQAYFDRAANLLHRPELVLTDEFDLANSPLPGAAGMVQVAGVGYAASPPPQWTSKATYEWKAGTLTTTLELSDERPSIAKLLLGISSAAANGGSGSAAATGGVVAPAGNGQTGGGGASSPSASFQTDSFAVSGYTYTLAETPDGNYIELYADGIEQPASNYTVSGAALTIASGVTLANWATIRVKYSYAAAGS